MICSKVGEVFSLWQIWLVPHGKYHLMTARLPCSVKSFHRCEVQFDYSLRQKRHLKLEDRPASFLTAEGKEIAVNRKVAAENDETAQKGKVITCRPLLLSIPNSFATFRRSIKNWSARYTLNLSLLLSLQGRRSGGCGMLGLFDSKIMMLTFYSLVNMITSVQALLYGGLCVCT